MRAPKDPAGLAASGPPLLTAEGAPEGWRGMWKASLPLVLGSTVGPAVVLLDGLFVAGIERAAFNGLVLAIPALALVSGVAAGLAAAGGEAFVRARIEESRRREAAAAVILAVIVGFAVLGAAASGRGALTAWYGLHPGGGLAREGAYLFSYWTWILPSLPAQVLLPVLLQLLVAAGRQRESTRLVVLVAALNMLLDPLLIYGAGLGIAGAALATNTAFAAGVAAAAWRLARPRDFISFRPAGALARAVSRQASDGGMIFGAIGISIIGDLLLAKLAAVHGPGTVTAFGIAEQVSGLFILPTRGICAGFIVVFGAHLSTRSVMRYRPTYRDASLLVALFYFAGAAALVLGAGPIARAYGFRAAEGAELSLFLWIAAAALLVSIPSRIAQVGFLSLRHAYGVGVFSAVVVGATYLSASAAMGPLGMYGIAVGRLVGAVAATGLMLPFFLALLSRRLHRDGGAEAATAPA